MREEKKRPEPSYCRMWGGDALDNGIKGSGHKPLESTPMVNALQASNINKVTITTRDRICQPPVD